MVEVFSNILTSLFGSNSWLATIFISMFPIIELKGAIPVGMSHDFWGNNALNSTQAYLCSLLGSSIVVPILALIFMPILKWMKSTKIFKKISQLIETKIKKSSTKINEKVDAQRSKKKTVLKMLGIFLFVADPFPFTGVWTGTCVGLAIGLSFWQTVLSIILGNLVAGTLVMFVCSVFPQFTTILFFVMLAIVLLVLVVMIVKTLASKNKANNLACEKIVDSHMEESTILYKKCVVDK